MKGDRSQWGVLAGSNSGMQVVGLKVRASVYLGFIVCSELY